MLVSSIGYLNNKSSLKESVNLGPAHNSKKQGFGTYLETLDNDYKSKNSIISYLKSFFNFNKVKSVSHLDEIA